MPSLVTDLLFTPFIRRARRFSERIPPDQQEVAAAAASNSRVEVRPSRPSSRSGSSAQHAGRNTPPPSGWLARQIQDQPPIFSASPSTLSFSEPDSPALSTTAAFATRTPTSQPMATSTPKKTPRELPEDDGMGSLRKRLLAIQEKQLPQPEKARLMHEALMEGHRLAQVVPGQRSPSSVVGPGREEIWERGHLSNSMNTLRLQSELPGIAALRANTPPPEACGSNAHRGFLLNASDVAPTYAPTQIPKNATLEMINEYLQRPRMLGCPHYRRNVKLQCSTCSKWYTCRFCHDSVESHALIRKDTQHMLCMLCATPQKASDVCIQCGRSAARYYCGICKLWDDHPTKNIYHCNDCGICRRGRGLGKDFFHCKKCCACISISIQDSHKCIERSTDCDCPICGEYMFTSPKPVVFMTCGHSIHSKCYDQHMRSSYKCPICSKSLINMQSQFRQLELAIQSQPMPPEFRDTKATVLCNDCSGKSTVPYHWLGLRCAICTSYNTVEMTIYGHTGNPRVDRVRQLAEQQQQAEQAQQAQRSAPPSLPANEVIAIMRQQAGSSAPIDAGAALRRRRHSSHAGPDGGTSESRQPVIPDRLARSASPVPPIGMLPFPAGTTGSGPLGEVDEVEESDEDMLRLWGTRSHQSSDDDLESMSDDEGFEEEEDDDEEDDDDDNEIVLIGHR